MKKEQWVYKDKKLVGKVTTKTHSDGSREIIKQKAYDSFGRHATDVTSRVRITK